MASVKKKTGSSNKRPGRTRDAKEDVGVISAFPNSPTFFGEFADFTQIKDRRLFRFTKKTPDLSPIREKLNANKEKNLIISQKVRNEINSLVNKHPDVPDLHALKAIQSYKDLQQFPLPEKWIIPDLTMLSLGMMWY